MTELIVIAALLVLWLIFRQRGQKRESIKSQHPAHHWTDNGNFDFEVVGESSYQPALKKIANSATENLTALLVPEPDNAHDKLAVAVYISALKVGYLSRDDAQDFHERLRDKGLAAQITSCDVRIYGGGQKNGKKLMLGVWLDMKPFN